MPTVQAPTWARPGQGPDVRDRGDARRDALIAVAFAVAAAPLLALLAASLAACGRPPLFRQERVGAGGRIFAILKFRTLDPPRGGAVPGGARGRAFAALGGFLRRSRMDELPQLLNIARGEMAFIGPRPLLPADVAAMPAARAARAAVRPGLTGLAQVCGGRWLGPREKLALDLHYVAHRSPALDVWILARTLGTVARGDARDPAWLEAALAGAPEAPGGGGNGGGAR